VSQPPPSEAALRDRETLARMARGQTEAVADLYDSYGPLVFSLLFRVVGDTALAEDLVQEVFVRVWRAAASYRPELGSVRAWLLSIAHHRAVDEWRRRRKEAGWVRLNGNDPEWLAGANDNLGDPFVGLALQALPKEQRQVIEMAYFQGLTMSEIATQLKLPLGTVKSRVRLAMTKLRAALGIDPEKTP